MSRRQFLGRAGARRSAASPSRPTLLAACGSDDRAARVAEAEASGSKSVAISNWTGYMDRRSCSKQDFEQDTGITRHLRRGHQRQQRVLRQDPAEPQQGPEHRPRRLRPHRLDGEPHDQPGEVGRSRSTRRSSRTRRTCAPRSQHPAFDPTRKYSAPWASGVTGIAYNIEHRPARRSGRSTTSSRSTGTKTVLDEMRDTVGLFMRSLGIDTADADLRRGAAGVRQARRRRSTTARSTGSTATSTSNDLGDGNLAAAFAWSGDVAQITLSTTRTCASPSRTRAGCSGPTTS